MRFLNIYFSHQYPFWNNANKERFVDARRITSTSGNCHIILIKDSLLRAGHRKPHIMESQSNWKHPSTNPSDTGCTFDQVLWWCSNNNMGIRLWSVHCELWHDKSMKSQHYDHPYAFVERFVLLCTMMRLLLKLTFVVFVECHVSLVNIKIFFM